MPFRCQSCKQDAACNVFVDCRARSTTLGVGSPQAKPPVHAACTVQQPEKTRKDNASYARTVCLAYVNPSCRPLNKNVSSNATDDSCAAAILAEQVSPWTLPWMVQQHRDQRALLVPMPAN